jgi:uncharacterized damage-inducible protein DinB
MVATAEPEEPTKPVHPANPLEPAREPPDSLSDPRELLAGYLDFYRAAVLRKLDGLSEEELRTSRLPSGWTPLELLKHLAYVERRWMRWGFTAEDVESPWGDDDPDTTRWRVRDEESTEEIRAFFLDQCAHSRRIVAGADLRQRARAGGRFDDPESAPTLIWILFHLFQEYARHVGHLDVVRELIDGVMGE